MLNSTIFLLAVLCLLPTTWSQEEGIEIVRNPEPQSVCEGRPANFTWGYNAANRGFQNIYWRHSMAGESTASIICEYLPTRNPPTFTSTGTFTGRLQNIAEAPKAVDGGEITLTVTETRLDDTGTIQMAVIDTVGKETTGAGALTVMKAPTLTDEQELGVVRSPHSMNTSYITCTNIQDPGSPPAHVEITRSVPGYADSKVMVSVENGEGKHAFVGTDRFGTFKCALMGPAADCSRTPYQSAILEYFTAPGTPVLEAVEPKGSSAKVTFKAGFHGGTKVNFTVKYQMQDAKEWTVAAVTVGHLKEGQMESIEIEGLQPMTNYSVYVVAANSQGSKQSMEQSFETKGPSLDPTSTFPPMAESDAQWSDGGLGGGAIAGIVIGVLVAIGAVVGVGVYCTKKGKKEKSSLEEMEKMNKPPVPV